MPFIHIVFFVISFAIIMIPVSTQAVIFSFDPADIRNDGRAYRVGFSFNVKFFLDTDGEKVSVADGIVLFTSEELEVVRVSAEHSIFRVWTREPQLIPNTNIIEFVGGIPGGFSGKGEIFNVTFRVKTEETAHVSTLYARALRFAELPTKLDARRNEAWYPFAITENIPKDFSFLRDLSIGDRSLDVVYLQLVLNAEELYSGNINGRFDEITRDAVLAFQERYLEEIIIPGKFEQPTGDADFWTRAKLNRLLPSIIFKESNPPAEQVSKELSPLFDINVGPGEQKESKKRAVIITAVIVTIGVVGAAVYIFRKKYAQ